MKTKSNARDVATVERKESPPETESSPNDSEFANRMIKALERPKAKKKRNGRLTLELSLETLTDHLKSLGIADRDLAGLVTSQIENIGGQGNATFFNAALAFIGALDPKDEIESLLLTQMFIAHSLAMKFGMRASLTEDHDMSIDNIKSVAGLFKAFDGHLEALNRHRGKGQQKVTVEHVTVNAGGQAIVGAVDRGANDKK